jgi:hypothetical protein
LLLSSTSSIRQALKQSAHSAVTAVDWITIATTSNSASTPPVRSFPFDLSIGLLTDRSSSADLEESFDVKSDKFHTICWNFPQTDTHSEHIVDGTTENKTGVKWSHGFDVRVCAPDGACGLRFC